MRATTLRRYGFAALLTAIAVALRQVIAPILGPGVTFLLAFPAVMVSAWYGGLGPGALSTALSASGILFLFYLCEGPLGVFELTRFIIFALSGALISVLCESLRRTTERAEAESAERGRAEASLRDNQGRLHDSERMLAESQRLAHVGSWELDLDNLDDLNANPLRWSDEAFRIFGYIPGQVKVTNALFFEAVHPDDRAAVAAAVTEAVRGRRMYQVEHRILRPDGAERFVYEWGTILSDPAGRPRRILGTCQDITDRKRAELALRNREDQLRLITDAVPALISYIDDQYRYQLANRAYQRWFGQDPAAMQGRHVRDVLGGEVWTLVQPPMERALAGEEVTYEQELPYPAGGSRWVSTSYTPDRDASGRVRGLVVLVHDVSERKLAESALRRAADRTERLQRVTAALSEVMTYERVAHVIVEQARLALGATGGCVGLLSEDGQALGLIQDVGYDPELTEPWQRFPLSADAPMAEAARAKKSVFIRSTEERSRRYPELTSFFASGPTGSSASVPMLIGDRLLGVLGLAWTGSSAFDEDDQQFILALARQCAQALERARLYEAEQRARAEAEASNKAKDQFLAVLSHELRTPLTAVLTAAHLLERGGSERRSVAEMASLIRRNAELEARLIDDLLDLTRVSRGKLSLTFESVDAHAKVHDVLRACASELDTKEIQVVTELEAQQHHVEVDQARFQQVIWNLVKNAAKFSKQGGRVFLRTRNDSPGMLTLEVTDEGIGIEQELLPRLFNAFEQGRREVTRHFGGLGLGLAVSKALVDAQGGSIFASSPGVNRGATFTVKVPLARAAADAGEGVDELTPSVGRARILLVEDHEDTAELMAELLRGKGYTVRVAGTVAEAVRIAESEPLDLLLSDLGLPDGTGFDLMRQVQARRPLRGIALSGFGMERDIQEAKAAGFVEHLTKPVNTMKLFKVISQVLGEP